MAVNESAIPRNLLIFGGNGFIGGATTERLLGQGHKVTLVNRGNWYWDSGWTLRPRVSQITCDRWQPLKGCSQLVEFLNSVGKIDAVIDFSAYEADILADTLDLVGSKIGLYIFISSDSVYEVCETVAGASVEAAAVRPTDPDMQEELQRRDDYGHRKLACEELLESRRSDKTGPAYVILRLPDVVGPRDSTNRWWTYQLWLRLHGYLDTPVTLPADLASRNLSLVAVGDVASTIVGLVENTPDAARDEAFNLAQKETITLFQMVEGIKAELNISNLEIAVSEEVDTPRLFPSVSNGPIDSAKAEAILGWNPTPWNETLKDTVNFYESAISNPLYDKERRAMVQTMQTYFTSKPYNVIRGLRDIYYLSYPQDKDEL